MGYLSFDYWVLRVVNIFCIRSLIRLTVCKYFLFWGLFFHFFDSFLCRTKFFNFVEVQFIYFFSCCSGHYLIQVQGFPGSSVGKEAACSARDTDSVPGSGWSLGGGNDNPPSVFLPGVSHGQEPGELQSIRPQNQTQLKWLSTCARNPSSQRFTPVCSFKSFVVLAFTLRSMICFGNIYV